MDSAARARPAGNRFGTAGSAAALSPAMVSARLPLRHLMALSLFALAALSGGPADAAPERHALSRINDYRAQQGLAPLQLEIRLMALSARRARSLSDMPTMLSGAGDPLDRRLHEAGYGYREAAEQIAFGYRNPETVVESWLGRNETRNSLLNREMLEAGIGYAGPANGSDKARHVWVLTLAAPTRAAAEGWRKAVLDAVNRFRARHDLPPLTLDSRLNEAAAGHAADMVARDFFGHVGPDGRSVADRVRSAGYAFQVALENLAAGHADPSDVVDGWIRSPPHRKAMLSAEATEAGVGYAFAADDGGEVRHGHYWTLNMARPAPSRSGGATDGTATQ